jgi:hypothetical protein
LGVGALADGDHREVFEARAVGAGNRTSSTRQSGTQQRSHGRGRRRPCGRTSLGSAVALSVMLKMGAYLRQNGASAAPPGGPPRVLFVNAGHHRERDDACDDPQGYGQRAAQRQQLFDPLVCPVGRVTSQCAGARTRSRTIQIRPAAGANAIVTTNTISMRRPSEFRESTWSPD